jgi:hypothetical protein
MVIVTVWIGVVVAVMGFVVPAGASSEELLDQLICGEITGSRSP